MTSAKAPPAKPKPRGWLRFPDPPEIPDERMTAFDHLTINGNAYLLAQHLGNPETTLVAGDHYLSLRFTRTLAGVRYPDLLVAFGVDPAAYRDTNAYVIDEQGKPPDFVLEIASPSTRRVDQGAKREEYAALGITEYWRFDQASGRNRVRLAGDRLEGEEYRPIAVEEPEEGVVQGYSGVLDLYLRWERGQLSWIDPATNRPIATLASERARANSERAARLAAEVRAERSEARVQELEERLRGQQP